jgi:hypothetical protein
MNQAELHQIDQRLTNRSNRIEENQRKLMITALLETYIIEYLPQHGHTNAMRQLLEDANGVYVSLHGDNSNDQPAVLISSSRMLGPSSQDEDSSGRYPKPDGKGYKYTTAADHRSIKEWTQDLLVFALQHGGILNVTEYRATRLKEVYGDNVLASKTKLNAATNTLSRHKLVRMIKAGLYELTKKGRQEAESYRPELAQASGGASAAEGVSTSSGVSGEKRQRQPILDRVMAIARQYDGVFRMSDYKAMELAAGRKEPGSGETFRAIRMSGLFTKVAEGEYRLRAAQSGSGKSVDIVVGGRLGASKAPTPAKGAASQKTNRFIEFAREHNGILNIGDWTRDHGGRPSGDSYKYLNTGGDFDKIEAGVYKLKDATGTTASTQPKGKSHGQDERTKQAIIDFANQSKHGEFAMDDYYDQHEKLFGVSPKAQPQLKGRVNRSLHQLIDEKVLAETEPGRYELRHMPEGKKSRAALAASA